MTSSQDSSFLPEPLLLPEGICDLEELFSEEPCHVAEAPHSERLSVGQPVSYQPAEALVDWGQWDCKAASSGVMREGGDPITMEEWPNESWEGESGLVPLGDLEATFLELQEILSGPEASRPPGASIPMKECPLLGMEERTPSLASSPSGTHGGLLGSASDFSRRPDFLPGSTQVNTPLQHLDFPESDRKPKGTGAGSPQLGTTMDYSNNAGKTGSMRASRPHDGDTALASRLACVIRNLEHKKRPEAHVSAEDALSTRPQDSTSSPCAKLPLQSTPDVAGERPAGYIPGGSGLGSSGKRAPLDTAFCSTKAEIDTGEWAMVDLLRPTSNTGNRPFPSGPSRAGLPFAHFCAVPPAGAPPRGTHLHVAGHSRGQHLYGTAELRGGMLSDTSFAGDEDAGGSTGTEDSSVNFPVPVATHWKTSTRGSWPTLTDAVACNWMVAESGSQGEEGECLPLGQQWALQRVVRHSTLLRGSTKRATGAAFEVSYVLVAPFLKTPQADLSQMPPPPVDGAFKRKLKSLLLPLAEAYATDDREKVVSLRPRVEAISDPCGNSVQRMGHWFLAALSARYEGTLSPYEAMLSSLAGLRKHDWSKVNVMKEMGRTCWFVFKEIVCTQPVIRATMGHAKVHIITLHNTTGLYWPALFRSLSSQPFVPSVKVTVVSFAWGGISDEGGLGNAIVPLLGDTPEALQTEARKAGLEIQVVHLHASCNSFEWGLIRPTADEATVVIDSEALMLFPDESVLKYNPRDGALKWIHSLNPKLVVVVELDGHGNSNFFLSRFQEMVTLVIPTFDALDSSIPRDAPARALFDFLFQSVLTNTVAADGLERFTRSERVGQWHERFQRAGFKTVAFEKDVWDSLRQLSAVDCKGSAEKWGEAARLVWGGSPFVFACLLVPR